MDKTPCPASNYVQFVEFAGDAPHGRTYLRVRVPGNIQSAVTRMYPDAPGSAMRFYRNAFARGLALALTNHPASTPAPWPRGTAPQASAASCGPAPPTPGTLEDHWRKIEAEREGHRAAASDEGDAGTDWLG